MGVCPTIILWLGAEHKTRSCQLKIKKRTRFDFSDLKNGLSEKQSKASNTVQVGDDKTRSVHGKFNCVTVNFDRT